MAKKIFLVDGMSLVFRAYHAMSASKLSNSQGEPTWAVFAFANMLLSIIEREQPEYMTVVFDAQAKTFRHEQFENYKANRKAFPEDLQPQLLRIKELIDLLAIPRIEMPGYEADDIIGTLCKIATKEKKDVLCVTSDKDYYQLVNEHICLYKPLKDTGTYEVVTAEMVPEKFGVPPHQVIDLLAIIGDTSDNIPGVKGVGEKTAIPLVQEFGTLENIYENLDQIKKDSLRKKLEENRDLAFLSKQLVTIHCDMDLPIGTNECKRGEPNIEGLTQFIDLLGLKQLRRRLNISDESAKTDSLKETTPQKLDESDPFFFPGAEGFAETIFKTIADVPHEYILVNTEELFKNMLAEISQSPILSFDLETDGLDTMSCRIVGIALSIRESRAFYVAVDDDGELLQNQKLTDAAFKKSGGGKQQSSLFDVEEPTLLKEDDSSGEGFKKTESLPIAPVLKELKPLLESEKIGKFGQNVKFDALILKRYGITVSPVEFDTMLASYILNPDDKHNLNDLSKKWLSYSPVPITDLIGESKKTQISMRDVAPELIAEYAGEDADLALKLRAVLKERLEAENLIDLARNVEFPLVEVLVQMEYNGVAIDTAALKEISEFITGEVTRLRAEIFKESGQEFLIDSPKQLGDILFGTMGIPSVKKTKTGHSTDVNVLTELAETYPIANMVLEYRQLQKLKNTYSEALPKLIHPLTGRVHTTFNQTVASTGRLSSTEPNLQNIPIRSELGRTIRKAFVAQDKDAVIFSADYSQIELRIMAYVCGDETLIEAFKNNHDIHAATAASLFGVPLDGVDGNMRRMAKTVNFGVMYGIGAFGLARRLGSTRNEASEIIKNYFDKYYKIKQYIDDTIAQADRLGYVTTMLGRRRYFPLMQSRNKGLRQAAERAAINAPIQGTAADMMKLAMINVHRAMQKAKMRSKMTLQVHDELVFEAMNDELEDLKVLVKTEMEGAFPLGEVPVLVETGVGRSWFEAH